MPDCWAARKPASHAMAARGVFAQFKAELYAGLPEQREEPDRDHQQEGRDDRAQHLLAFGVIGPAPREQLAQRLAEDESRDQQNDDDMRQDSLSALLVAGGHVDRRARLLPG